MAAIRPYMLTDWNHFRADTFRHLEKKQKKKKKHKLCFNKTPLVILGEMQLQWKSKMVTGTFSGGHCNTTSLKNLCGLGEDMITRLS